jgi:hypothetical protein
MTTKLSAIASLVMTRMLVVGEKGESTANIKKDIGPLLSDRWAGAELTGQVAQTLGDLESIGLVMRLPAKSKKAALKYLPTAEGRRWALEFLGIAQLKPKTTWAAIKKTYLPARALGISASSDALIKTLNSEPSFQALLLRWQYNLPVPEIPKPDEAIDALAWKLMGFEGEARKFNLENIKTALFNRESGDDRATKFKKAAIKLLARRLYMGNDDPKKLRDAVVRGWIDETETPSPSIPSPAPAASIELDLPAFAEKVKAAARVCPTGRFGDNKVFISHLWKTLKSDRAFAAMDLASFKERLAEANNARLLDLSKADLVQAMDAEDVRDSEVHYLSTTFHFVRI